MSESTPEGRPAGTTRAEGFTPEPPTLALSSVEHSPDEAAAATEASRRVPAPGAVSVPGYEVLEELGRGGMAVVYKARDKQLEREVAIKVLPFSLSFDAEFVERFQREARTAGKL